MDTFLKDLITHLRADAPLRDRINGRIYPGQAPQDALYPFLVYTEVSLTPEYNLSGLVNNRDRSTRIQFDVYAQTYAAAQQIREIILNTLDAFHGTMTATFVSHSELVATRALYDQTTQIQSQSFDLTFWHRPLATF